MKKFKDFLLTKGISQDAFDKLEETDKAALHSEYLDEIGKAVELKASKDDLKDFISKTEAEESTKTAVQEATKEMKETIEEQGKTLAALKLNKGESQKQSFEEVFKEKYDAVVTEQGENKIVKDGEQISFECKAIVSTDIMPVNTVSSGTFPASGATGVVNATIRTLYAKVIGYFGVREVTSNIMDRVTVEPLDSATLIAVNESYTGNAEITPECTLKPIVRMSWDTQTVEADPVAAMWFTTTKLRRFFARLVNNAERKFAELINLRIPDRVNAYISVNATAFTPNAGLVMPVGVTPNKYDALAKVIASIEALNYMPNEIRMHPYAWADMKTEKNAEGVYNLSNGMSISLVDRGIDWGGVMIPIERDATLGVNDFIVGDMSQVIVGLDSTMLYYETDGRTDAAADPVTGLQKNIRTHVLEKFLAIILPDGRKAAIVKDTFPNVITLITAEAP